MSRSSTSSIVSQRGAIVAPCPPVAMKRGVGAELAGDAPGDPVDRARRSRRRSRTGSRPGCCAPIAASGSASSILGSFAARAESASIEISTPGAITPPRYSPSAETASKLIAVPKSTDDAGAAEPVVGGDRVDEPVGAELVRVVDPDRHPGLQAWARPSGSAARGGARRAARTRGPAAAPPWRRSSHRGPRSSRSRHPQQGGQRRASSSAVALGLGGEAPVRGELRAVEGADVGLGVADVDREKHRAIIAACRR